MGFCLFFFELVLLESGSILSKFLSLYGYVIPTKNIKISRIIECPSGSEGVVWFCFWFFFFGPFSCVSDNLVVTF